MVFTGTNLNRSTIIGSYCFKSIRRSESATNKMFLQCCRDELHLSFIFVQRFRFVGQDAASERHHCRKIKVGSTNFGITWTIDLTLNT